MGDHVDSHLQDVTFDAVDGLALSTDIYDTLRFSGPDGRTFVTLRAGTNQPYMREFTSPFFEVALRKMRGAGPYRTTAAVARGVRAVLDSAVEAVDVDGLFTCVWYKTGEDPGSHKVLLHRETKMYGVLVRVATSPDGIVVEVHVVGFVPEDRLYTFAAYDRRLSENEDPFPPTHTGSIVPDDRVTRTLLCSRVEALRSDLGLDASDATVTCSR